MKNKFIYSPTKSLFEKKLAAGEIGEGSIVFIEDTKEIWNRGHYFGMVGSGSGIDPEILSGIETAIATLQSDKADKSELSDYAKKDELPSLDGYLTKTVADGLYATIAQYNDLNQTVGDIQTELSNKATKDELSTGLAGKLDNSAADGFVPKTRKVNGKALDQDITITATDLNAATKEELGNVNTDLQTFKNNVALTYATDQDVADAVAALVDSSPAALNTLNELAAALGDDPNFATTVATQIGTKADQTALDATNTNVTNLTAKVNENSVSKSEETLTVSINGTTQSLTNTWRGISDAVDSTSTSVSASSKAVKTAYDTAVAAQSAANTAQTTANSKWTYSESTIKGVKVNNAGNADTVAGFTVGCNVPADAKFTDTNTKVTSAANHYTPTAESGSQLSVDASSSTAASWNSTSLVTGVNIQRDSKGHVTGVTVDSIKMPANPNTDTNTTYSAGTGLSLSGTTFSHADTNTNISTDTSYGPTANVTQSAKNNASFKVPQITLDQFGHVKSVTERTITVTDTDTNTDTNTHYTTRLYAGASGTAANAAASNPYVKITDDNTYRNQIQIKGSGATTVSSDANGVITISSTDTNTHPDLSSYATQTWVTNKGYITGITKTMVTNALGYTPPTTNTTYSAATTSAAGLMSATDKSKLDGIASGATAVSSSTVSGWGFTKNAGTVTGIKINGSTKSPSSGVVDLGTVITSHQSLSGYATQSWVQSQGYKTTDTNTWRPIYNGVDSTATDTSASANAVKTAYDKAVSAYNLANGKTSNTGTVTSVATGAGLVGGTITSSGTIKAALKSETKSTLEATAMGSTSGRQYAVGLDKNGVLSVNIPWTDANTTYTLSSLGIGNVKNYDQSKAIKSITRSGTTFTYTCLDGTTGTFTQQDNNTTYGAATTSANGLMTTAMVTKLNGIASGATAVSSSTVSGWGFTKNTGTVTSITPGTGLTGTSSDSAITTSGTINLKMASTSEIGGIRIPTDDEITAADNYALSVTSDGAAYTSIPRTDSVNSTVGLASAKAVKTAYDKAVSASTAASNAQTTANSAVAAASNVTSELSTIPTATTITEAEFLKRNSYRVVSGVTVTLPAASVGGCNFMCVANAVFRCTSGARVITFNTNGTCSYSNVAAGGTFTGPAGTLVEVTAFSTTSGILLVKIYKLG